MSKKHFVMMAVAATWLAVQASVFGVGPSFQPDVTFRGSTLTGWQTVGGATWRAENGEIVGAPQQPGGGWLMLDRSYQDVGFYASFLCAPGCKTGVLMRAEKTSTGTKGIYVALTDGELASYSVLLDAQGQIVRRDSLRPAGGSIRIAPPPDPNPPASAPAGGRQGGPAVKLPFVPPDSGIQQGAWNRVEIYIDANIVRTHVNDSGTRAGGVAAPEAGNFGPLALYVGGTGEVRFKDVAYKDLSIQVRPVEKVSSNFRMQRLSDFYYAWGAGATDVNHDNVLDVISGPHVFYGPDFTKRSEIYLQLTSNPSTEFTRDNWMQFVGDFTGDGWGDALNCSFSGNPGCWLYVNPKGESRRWDKHLVIPGYQTEIGVVKDVDADGIPELVYGGEGQMRYAKPSRANPTGTWEIHSVSERGLATAHGVGAGDINGDGRVDIINPYGWWEQPAAEAPSSMWNFHPQVFGRYGWNIMGGSVMAVYDVNGDKLNDVVTVLNAHGWGMAWFEQKRDAKGQIAFERHMIMDDPWSKNAGGVAFSQPHGTNVGDIDGDGIPDFIVGKRYWSHLDDYNDPDPYGPAVLYVFRTVRNRNAPGGAEFVPELIHNRSGAGSDVYPVDLNRDGRMDILTATRYGTFVFFAQPGK